MACTAGWSAAAACVCWNASTTRTAAVSFDFRPTLFFGVPTIYVRMLDVAAGDRAQHR